MMQSDGYKVGYMKPVSTQPWRTPDGKLADEDAVFVHSSLGLDGDPLKASTIIVTASALRERLKGLSEHDLVGDIQEAVKTAGEGKDVLLLEGGASLHGAFKLTHR
jgi:dihydrofolate reductase